jgi:hypothetical protein
MICGGAMNRKGEPEMDHDFLNAVKSLTTSVLDFLNASDGCDDQRITNMSTDVADVLGEARKIPALKAWAEQIAEDEQ